MISSGLEELAKRGKYLSSPSGSSMEPLFHNKDNAVEIVTAKHPLQKYDISLHIGRDGRCVLHRIMEVRDGSYVICGDNCIVPEIVPFDRVVGVATKFYRNGKWHTVNDKRYKLYVKIWCGLYPVRKYILKATRLAKRIGKRLK